MHKYALLCLLMSYGHIVPTSGAVLSVTNSGIFLVIGAPQPISGATLDENAPMPFDQKLVWEPFSNIGAVDLNYPSPEFGIRVRMYGPDGREALKTGLGSLFGSKFDLVKSYEDVIVGSHMGGIAARQKYIELGRGYAGGNIPAPDDLFLMEKTGLYSLEIEMLMFRIMKTTPTHWDRQLLRFPAIEIKVEKPVTAPFFAFSATNQGIYICFRGTKTNGLVGFDDDLKWRPIADDDVMLHSLDLSYGFKMNLRGPDGKAVPKKGPGETIGAHFDSVKTMKDLPTGIKLTYLGIMGGRPLHVREQPFPVLKDCFAIDKPGIYTLELQMQLFRIIEKQPYGPEPEELVRFPPMTITVNEP
jgi:hypothetical protein